MSVSLTLADLDALLSEVPEWHRYASCREVGGDLWFPENGENAAEAKQVCAVCPVRGECLDYAVTAHELEGVWGGMSPLQLRQERKRRGLDPYGPGHSPLKAVPDVAPLPTVAVDALDDDEPTDAELAELDALLDLDELTARAA